MNIARHIQLYPANYNLHALEVFVTYLPRCIILYTKTNTSHERSRAIALIARRLGWQSRLPTTKDNFSQSYQRLGVSHCRPATTLPAREMLHGSRLRFVCQVQPRKASLFRHLTIYPTYCERHDKFGQCTRATPPEEEQVVLSMLGYMAKGSVPKRRFGNL